MIAIYDTAKNFNRVLYWDDENRLTKTVDTSAGKELSTTFAYDVKGMRIIKNGPYGKSIYIDTGYVESSGAGATTMSIVSNHVFVGNTRVASVVKHKEEPQAAMYFYASDHLGSSSVLTNQQGSYHERIEYLPYGEIWVEDAAQSGGYSTPYKFTGKELDKETGLYYFGARYYDARLSRWISTDPALEKYIPKPNDYDTEHDFYWYILNDASGKLPGMGGVFNYINMNLYHYAGMNPVKYVDPDGNNNIPWEFMSPELRAVLSFIDGLVGRGDGSYFAEYIGINAGAAYIGGMSCGYIDAVVGLPVSILLEKDKSIAGHRNKYDSGYSLGKNIGNVQNMAIFVSSISKHLGKKVSKEIVKAELKSIANDKKKLASFAKGFAKGMAPDVFVNDFDNSYEMYGYVAGKMGMEMLPNDVKEKVVREIGQTDSKKSK